MSQPYWSVTMVIGPSNVYPGDSVSGRGKTADEAWDNLQAALLRKRAQLQDAIVSVFPPEVEA